MDENDLMNKPVQLYNMDETGMRLEHRTPNIIAKKGKKKIRYRSTGNKAQITIVGSINAVGNGISPMIIYAAKGLNADWCKSDVPAAYALSPEDWINQELFKQWLRSDCIKWPHGYGLMALWLWPYGLTAQCNVFM